MIRIRLQKFIYLFLCYYKKLRFILSYSLKKNLFKIPLFLATTAFTVSSCYDVKLEEAPQDTFVSQFYNNTSTLEIMVGYEKGAEPFTSFSGKSAWEITKYNINLLLNGNKISVMTPRSIEKMNNLGVLEQNNYTKQNILDISARFHNHNDTNNTRAITVVFLDGYYIKDGKPKKKILGINLDGTSTIAIFKPVVVSAGTNAVARTLIEQTTITHEIGHALGLVNNGVAATSAHHDIDNGAHCMNKHCVMYWSNSGTEISQFIQSLLAKEEITLFGEQCLADLKTK